KLADEVHAAFAATGSEIDLHLVDGADVTDTLATLSAPVVAVGGGDGTQGAAAAQLSSSGQTLAVLPLGTRNHLARQIGVPLDLPGAAKVAASGRSSVVDLGAC